MMFLALLATAYLLGSIPTGPALVKLVKRVDLRDYGSGNTGAANVLRVAGPKLAAAVVAADLLKGFIPVAAARLLLSSTLAPPLVGLAATSGHVWSLFLGFKGGKGVLTALGGLVALAPVSGLISATIGGTVMAVSRYSSLGSLTGTLAGAVSLLTLIASRRKPAGYLVQVLLPPLLIIATHRENIQRLLSGTERKLTQGTEKRTK
ncbi:MAG: glycerol-3-phosphate 1-O-acyltransferase PlsY, partial [Dehalococcoidia bacterium]